MSDNGAGPMNGLEAAVAAMRDLVMYLRRANRRGFFGFAVIVVFVAAIIAGVVDWMLPVLPPAFRPPNGVVDALTTLGSFATFLYYLAVFLTRVANL